MVGLGAAGMVVEETVMVAAALTAAGMERAEESCVRRERWCVGLKGR